MRFTQSLAAAAPAVAFLALASNSDAQVQSEVVVQNLASPLFVTQPFGDDRLFVLEQTQADVEIIENGAQLGSPFLDLTGLASTGGERGLLGLAFHPDYDQNGYFFVNYTGPGGATFVDRFTVLGANPNQADPASRITLLQIPQPFSNHNAGWIGFGPDGYLYVATGDGGSANDPGCRAQDPQSYLGKMLRLDVDSIDGTGSYSIPASNPFVGQPGVLPEIYHLGLRNPFRCGFDVETGDLLIGDVGQDAREEISFAPAGVAGINFGWRILEGNNCNGQGNCPVEVPGCGFAGFTGPVYQYNHGVGGICSVTGGYRYRGYAMPAENGNYYFADYCSDDVWSFQTDGVGFSVFRNRSNELALSPNLNAITSFGTDTERNLYIVSANASGVGGRLIKVVPADGITAPTPDFIADWDALSIVDGGTQRLLLDAGSGFGGQLYFVFGSTSGTSPGLPVDGFNVPLNVDAYTNFTLASPNSAILQGSLGFLDPTGGAETRFNLPAGFFDSSAIGMEVNHAAVVFSAAITVDYVSNPTTATLF